MPKKISDTGVAKGEQIIRRNLESKTDQHLYTADTDMTLRLSQVFRRGRKPRPEVKDEPK